MGGREGTDGSCSLPPSRKQCGVATAQVLCLQRGRRTALRKVARGVLLGQVESVTMALVAPPSPGRVSPAPSPSAEAFTLADESPSQPRCFANAVLSLGLGVCEVVCEPFKKKTSVSDSTLGPLDITSVSFLSQAFWGSSLWWRSQGPGCQMWGPNPSFLQEKHWIPKVPPYCELLFQGRDLPRS